MRVALRTSKQRELARFPRDRYRHQQLLHVASIDAVVSKPQGLGPVVARPEGPLSVRGETARWRILAWTPGPYSRPPRPASRGAPPKPEMPGLPSCSAPPPARVLRRWHAPTLAGRAMDARNNRSYGDPNMGVVLLSCIIWSAIIRERETYCSSQTRRRKPVVTVSAVASVSVAWLDTISGPLE